MGKLGLVLGLVLSLAALAVAQTVDTTPNTVLTWDQPAANLAEANAYRIRAFVGDNATKVIANPNDSTAGSGLILTFTCTGTTSPFVCKSTSTAATIAGSSNPGTYTVALVGERRRADNTYAPRVVSALCSFRFTDSAPSLAPTNLRFLIP